MSSGSNRVAQSAGIFRMFLKSGSGPLYAPKPDGSSTRKSQFGLIAHLVNHPEDIHIPSIRMENGYDS